MKIEKFWNFEFLKLLKPINKLIILISKSNQILIPISYNFLQINDNMFFIANFFGFNNLLDLNFLLLNLTDRAVLDHEEVIEESFSVRGLSLEEHNPEIWEGLLHLVLQSVEKDVVLEVEIEFGLESLNIDMIVLADQSSYVI